MTVIPLSPVRCWSLIVKSKSSLVLLRYYGIDKVWMDIECYSDYEVAKLQDLLNKYCTRERVTYVPINKKPSK
jgi:hypothetical protein